MPSEAPAEPAKGTVVVEVDVVAAAAAADEADADETVHGDGGCSIPEKVTVWPLFKAVPDPNVVPAHSRASLSVPLEPRSMIWTLPTSDPQ